MIYEISSNFTYPIKRISPIIIPPSRNPKTIQVSCSFFAWLNFLCLINALILSNLDLIKKFTNAKARKITPINTINVKNPIIRKKIPKSIHNTPAILFKDIIVLAELGSDLSSSLFQYG
jgi:hypothetical protein